MLPCPAIADQIILKNGDTITGKIGAIEKNQVTIKPEYAEKMKIKLTAISSMVTDEPLEVELYDGELINARFVGSEDGNQRILVDEQPGMVDIVQLKKAKPPQPYYQRESKAESLLTINDGNTVNQSAAFKFDTLLRLGKHRQYMLLAMQRDSNNEVDTKKQDMFQHEYNWLFRKGWYIGSTSTYERDPIRDLSRRFTFGALVGHDFLDNNDSFLTVKAGGGYTDEKLGGEPSQGPVGLWELDFRFKLNDAGMELFHEQELTLQKYGEDNMIINTNTGVKMDVMWDIYATANYRYNYESEPAPTKLSKDSTLGFGLGVKF
jgi:putative salt-induced outer membrane protein YdiY